AISVGVSRILRALLSGDAYRIGVAVVAGIRRQGSKVGVFSSVERQFLDKRPLQHGGGGGFLRSKKRRGADYFNRVLAGSDLQLDILRRGISDQHPHPDLNIT